MKIRNILAVARKELKLNLRFKYDYFFKELLTSVRFLLLFFVVYYGFFSAGAPGIGSLKRESYILFLLLGTLTYSLFASSFGLFYTKFLAEKYWNTIQAILISPLTKMELILGVGLSELVKYIYISPIFFIIAFIWNPISIANFILVIFIMLLLFIGVLGVSLIQGAFTLSNENFLFLFQYLFWGWGFISCFYYPIEALPKFLHFLVLVNPIYHGLFIIRSLWISGFVENFWMHFSIVLIFAIVVPAISIYLFNKIIKKYGIRGY